MDSTLDDQKRVCIRDSLRDSWRHCKEMFSASSWSAAWQSFNKMVDVLPTWFFVVFILCAVGFVVNWSMIQTPLAVVGFLAAVYFTVKYAVLAAWRERDMSGRG